MSALLRPSDAVSETALQNCLDSVLWSLRTQTNAMSVLRLSQEELNTKVNASYNAALELAELCKMLELDHATRTLRESITDGALARARIALAAHPRIVSELLWLEEIDFSRVAPISPIDADEINRMRPDHAEQIRRFRWLRA
ncbi:hypothetical protein [Aromatoleum evansii]|uniref:hypothetical protein n=1 Tax=Aromatoleum evansii TaxID=59406 RepID=UPI00145DFA5D|nr:hypothetical protein [Aromatoleum evansii]NMG31473.1 hypothetical protein [Aromatoleum evansii]